MAQTGFNVKSGILDNKHREQMGMAVWEFLWCIDRTTSEQIDDDGHTWGIVLGGKPIHVKEIAEDIGTHPETIRKNLRRLCKYNYLILKRTPYGNIIKVSKSLKWRPKAKPEPKKVDKPNFVHTFEQEFGRPISPTEYQKLQSYISDGLSNEMVSEAIKRARMAGNVNMYYIEGILKRWHSANIKTLAQVKIADLEHEKIKNRRGQGNNKESPKNKGKPKTDKYDSLYMR